MLTALFIYIDPERPFVGESGSKTLHNPGTERLVQGPRRGGIPGKGDLRAGLVDVLSSWSPGPARSEIELGSGDDHMVVNWQIFFHHFYFMSLTIHILKKIAYI